MTLEVSALAGGRYDIVTIVELCAVITGGSGFLGFPGSPGVPGGFPSVSAIKHLVNQSRARTKIPA